MSGYRPTQKGFEAWLEGAGAGECFVYCTNSFGARDHGLFASAMEAYEARLVILYRRNVGGREECVAQRVSSHTLAKLDKISKSIKVPKRDNSPDYIPFKFASAPRIGLWS